MHDRERPTLEESAAAQFDTGGRRPAPRSCPVTGAGAVFNPFAGAFHEEPYGFLEAARRDEPVFYSPEIDHWVVTRYQDVKSVFQSPALYSAANTLSAVTAMSPRVLQRLRDEGFRMNPVLTNLDPPEHQRIRKHVSNAFSSKRVAETEPWIRTMIDEYIDRLQTLPRRADGCHHADMVGAFAYELPAYVVFKLMGVPSDQVANVKAWTKNRVALTWGRCTEEQQLQEVSGLVNMWRLCEVLVENQLAHQDASFLGALVDFHLQRPDELSVNEIESILFTMFVAGHETTTNAIANGLQVLLTEHSRWDLLCREPELIPSTVEEILRYRAPVITWRRIATKDVELGGQRLAAGDRILLMLASANHDEAKFEHPESFDATRSNAREHLAFGSGAHLCIGASLARLELKLVLERLTQKLPLLKLDSPQVLNYAANLSFRGPSALWVHWK
jgi:cytochrome P450